MKRREIREKLVNTLYACMIQSQITNDFDPIEILCNVFETEYENIDLYAKEVFVAVLSNQAEIIKSCQEHLINWKFERLNNVAKAILLGSVAEGNYVKQTNKKIIINEAVSIAKNLIPGSDYKYINAVLDKVINE